MNNLSSLACIRFVGVDMRSFLQGQLSNDLELLSPGQSLMACCNSAQGRVQAIIRLIERTDGIFAIVPRSIVETTINRLRKFVLRAKVSIEDARDLIQIAWVNADQLAQAGWPDPASAGEHIQQGSLSVLRWPDAHQERFVVLQPGVAAPASAELDHAWQLAEIRAGLPQVLTETHESFVAQMLNLDLLSGISFNKGCYTGQEIIARAHFRGVVKRRMFRLAAACSPPAAGTRILAGDTHAGEVVMSAVTDNGCELLGVVSLAQRHATLHLDGQPAATLEFMTLPYAVPDEA